MLKTSTATSSAAIRTRATLIHGSTTMSPKKRVTEFPGRRLASALQRTALPSPHQQSHAHAGRFLPPRVRRDQTFLPLGNPPPAEDQRKDEQDDEDDEQNLRNGRREAGHAEETEEPGNDGDDQETDCVIKHDVLLVAEGLPMLSMPKKLRAGIPCPARSAPTRF